MIDLITEESMGTNQEIRIKVMGVGGGGCHVLHRLTQDHVQNVSLVAVNTDEDTVNLMAKFGATGIQIGEKLTHGNGAGGKVEIGEQAAEEAAGQIEDALKEANLVFLVSCLGGGTGTGGTPVVARIAKELGVLSIGIVTTPFRFEGRRKLRLAEEAIRKMRGQLDALIVINNDNMLKLSKDKSLSIHDAFRAADEVLRQGIRLITDLILRSGVVNIDFADLATVLRSSENSEAIIGIGESRTSATDAVRNALASPLLDRTIEGAHDIILNVVGDESLTLSSVEEASEYLRTEARTDVDMIFGSACDPEMAGRIQAMVVAANFVDKEYGDNRT